MGRASSADWREMGICSSGAYDPDLWFNEPKEAKVLCRACPVRNECLTWALGIADLFGVAGGLTERERRVIRGRRRRALEAEKKEKVA